MACFSLQLVVLEDQLPEALEEGHPSPGRLAVIL